MKAVDNLPSMYRKDPWILALEAALGAALDRQSMEIAGLVPQMSLDTVSWNLPVEERVAGITPPAGATLDSRREALKAQWRSGGKVDRDQVQMVADAWRNGAVEVTFAQGRIVVQFVGPYGVPDDLPALKDAVALVIPTHLPVDYLFRYLLIRDIHLIKTLEEMDQIQLHKFAGGKR